MLLQRFILLFLCVIASSDFLYTHPQHDRYNPNKKILEPRPKTHHKGIAPEESDDELDATFQAEEGDELVADEEGRGPLGSVCIELADYCSYFANNLMTDATQEENRQSLYLFSNVMHLMADLADQDAAYVRAETYASDLTSIVKTMKHIYNIDTSFAHSIEHYPLLDRLFSLHETRTPKTDLDIELGIYVHTILRTQETAEPLISALFAELNLYAQTKIHVLLGMFHEDTRQLFDRIEYPTKSQGKPPYSRHMRQMSWLCHHAADACLDLANSFQASPLLTPTLPLMNQLHAMLNAMAITYNNLGAEAAFSRTHDRHELAAHFATMIHLLPVTTPHRTTKHSPESAYLDKCTALASQQEKQHFIERTFETELDRDALLAEFFPAVEKSFDYNLQSLGSTLSRVTLETLATRYWKKLPELLEDLP